MLKYLAFSTMLEVARNIVIIFNQFIVIYIFVISSVYIIQMFISLLHSPKYTRRTRIYDTDKYAKSQNLVPISILIPAHNEEKTVVSSIQALLDLNYSAYELVVVNDGSNDETLSTIINAFQLERITFPLRSLIETKEVRGIYYNPEYPNLHLIDKENGGKADALNAGINFSRYPYFVSIDADSLLDSDALIRIAMSFMEYKYTIAVGGIIRVANGCKVQNGKVSEIHLPKSKVALFQVVEYFRAFLVGRVGWSVFNSLMIISGAFGAFQKEAVLKVGGYNTETVGEDMELVVKLHMYMREKKYKYKISFLPDPICWTQVPETVRDLYRQRRRWQIGLIDSLRKGKRMFLNPKYGTLGMLAFPYYFFFELLGPVVEGLGLIIVPLAWYYGLLSVEFFILFLICTTIFGVVLSVGALAIEEYTLNKYVRIRDFFKLSVFGVIENFGYRQMTVLFRLLGFLLYWKYKNSWSNLKRKEFEQAETTVLSPPNKTHGA